MFDGKSEEFVVAKLEEAFMWGATDEAACVHAGISRDALYRYVEKKPLFRDRKELLKKNLVLQSYKTVAKNVETDAAMALRVLERKEKGEWSPHQTFAGMIGSVTEADEDGAVNIGKALRKWAEPQEAITVDEKI